MHTGSAGPQHSEGLRLLEAAQWAAARDVFQATLEEEETPEALDGVGLALFFLGSVEDGIAARERAFDAYVDAGRCDEAGRVGVWVSHQYLLSGRASAARGWLARAERAVAGAECDGQGWVAIERARHAEDLEERTAHTRRAMDIARNAGDSDLEVYALSLLGLTEVNAGRLDSGMQLLEEAMAAASAGRVRNVHTLAEAYCNLIMATTNAGDWDRASEWCDLVDGFAREHGTIPLLGACRTIHAEVLVARGRWPEAETALESALETHSRFVPEMGAPTVAGMAELRVHQGRLAEAEQLLAGREEHPSSLCALAHLRIADGHPRVAAAPPGARPRRRRRRRGPHDPAPGPAGGLRAWPAATSRARRWRPGSWPTWPRPPASGWWPRARSWPPRTCTWPPGRRARPPSPHGWRWPRTRGWGCRCTWARHGWRWPGRSWAPRPRRRATRRGPRWTRSGNWVPRAPWTPPRACCASSARPPARVRAARAS